jgi:DnaA family protein
MKQLLLGVQLNDYARFENFYPEKNDFLVDCLQRFISDDEQFICLSGEEGSGKSHLLQSCCHLANQQAKRVFYISFAKPDALQPQMLESLESFDLICLDDLDKVLLDQQWEEALFNLYNRLRDAKGKLLVATQQPVAALNFYLPDLRSRLQWGAAFRLEELSDNGKLAVLQSRAESRGFELNQTIASFLMTHCPRNMRALMAALDKLDQASLQQQRVLTIPFVKEVLSL